MPVGEQSTLSTKDILKRVRELEMDGERASSTSVGGRGPAGERGVSPD